MLRHRVKQEGAPTTGRGVLRRRVEPEVVEDMSPGSSVETQAYVREAAVAAETMLNTAELARMAKGIVTNGDKGLHNVSLTAHWAMVKAVTDACSLQNWGERGSSKSLPEKHASSPGMILVPRIEVIRVWSLKWVCDRLTHSSVEEEHAPGRRSRR